MILTCKLKKFSSDYIILLVCFMKKHEKLSMELSKSSSNGPANDNQLPENNPSLK